MSVIHGTTMASGGSSSGGEADLVRVGEHSDRGAYSGTSSHGCSARRAA